MVDTTVSPYFDDYDENDGYYRVLFRPSRAVQARELTQMQTALQNQITRFGQNIFLEGSLVVPGGASVDTNYEYVKIDDVSIGSIVAGATLSGNTSGLAAKVIQIVEAEDSDPNTLYVRYTGGGSSDGGRFQDAETITWTNPVSGSGSYTVSSSGTGTGTKVDLQKSVYFVRGFFAVATSQSLIIEKYGVPTGTQELGLVIAESIVTSDTDTDLLSPASGTSNVNAPGADRLKYTLTLTKKSTILDSAGETTSDYFTIVTLKDAVIVEQVTRSTYALLGDELASRTYDESGNYTVDPFIVDADDHPSDATKLRLTIDPGRAYVRGYLVDKTLITTYDIDKALVTETKNNSKTSTYFGNYIRVNTLVGAPHLDTFEAVNLRDSTTVRGTARVRAVELESGSIYRLYLFDVQMNSGYSFNVVDNVVGTGWTAALVDLAGSAVTDNAEIYDIDSNSLIFRVPFSRIKSHADITARVQRHEVQTTDGSGNVTLDTGSDDITWENTASWIVFRNDTGAIVTGDAGYGSSGARTIAVSGLTSSTAHTFIAYVDKTTATTTARTKTLTTVTDSTITPNGDDSVDMGQFDIYTLDAVKDASAGDADITDRYRLDNGHRDNFYGEGKIILKAGETAPAGDVKITFKYFAHGAGDYFNVDSYNSFIAGAYDYGDIPFHYFANGEKVRLADVYDFRPKKDNANADFTSTGAYINELPENNETIQSDVTYYLPRRDVLYIDKSGTFGTVVGNPSLTPQLGQVPQNAMALYNITVYPGTVSATDIETEFIENKRYTMRDIGAIEARINRLEEWSTLSLLESSTQSLEVLDNSGNNRFKSGFFVDNFNDFAFADWENTEYRASIDPRLGELRPSFVENNTRMVYRATASDSSSSSGVTRVGDSLMLDYTETVEITQPLASSAINVNPYNVVTNTGTIRLSPLTDEWRDVETTTRRNTIQETARVNPVQENNWDNWRWNWAGTPVETPRTFDTGGRNLEDARFLRLF